MSKHFAIHKKHLLMSILLFFSQQTLALDKDLPGNHTLKENEQGEYFLENEDGIVMIDPSILAIGHSKLWIVACIKNKSIDSDLKRMVFVNLKWGGTTDSINRENWAYFREKLAGLDVVSLQQISDENCP